MVLNKEDFYKLGAAVLSGRKKQGLTQERLAANVGCSVRTIYTIERGTRKEMPPLELLLKIGEVCEITLGKMLPSLSDEFIFTLGEDDFLTLSDDDVLELFDGGEIHPEFSLLYQSGGHDYDKDDELLSVSLLH